MRKNPNAASFALTCATWVVLVLFVLGCGDPLVPAYLRMSGDAPSISGLTPSQATLVVFWASWCPPCCDEMPGLRRLAHEPPAGMRVVVLGHDETSATARTFFGGEIPASLSFRLDEGQSLGRSFEVDRLPIAFLVVA